MSTITEQLEARGHHPFSPSTLANREACPCYESCSEQHIRSIAGTLAHAVVETREDNEDLSDEDAEAAAECIDFVEERRKVLQAAWETRARLHIEDVLLPIQVVTEELLPIDECVFDESDCTTAGYVDHIILDLDARYAEMIDYKFGVWPVEDAKVNLQGIAYVLGAFKRWPKLQTLRFFFKQPLIHSLTEAVFSRSDIPALYLRVQVVVARARKAKAEIEADNWTMAKPTVPVCNFCNRIGSCPRVLEIALNVGKKFHPVGIPDNISPTMVMEKSNASLALRLAQVVQVWASAFRTQITNRIREGRAVLPDGYMLQANARRELVDKDQFKSIALNYLTPLEYDNTLDVLFGAVEKAISAKAPRGSKKETLELVRAAWDKSGATKKGNSYTFLKARPENANKENQPINENI